MKKNFEIFWVFIFTSFACSTVKNLTLNTDIERTFDQSSLFNSQFTGFSLYDIAKGEFISGFNETKRFTPASNVKLLTMYAALKSFQDSIPGLIYQTAEDSIWVQPVGDPTFLDSRFSTQPAYEVLKSSLNTIHIVWPEYEILPYGPGWAWDDYKYSFQPQRNWWPIYGNRVSISKKQDSILISPSFFEEYIEILESEEYGEHLDRELKYNLFTIKSNSNASQFEKSIPFEFSRELLLTLLADTLGKKPHYSEKLLTDPDTLYSQHLDSVLSVMMKVSDNHIADQLLILSAWKNGYSSLDGFIQQVKLIWLNDLNDFVWVDGSGLSRYNLIAPVDQVKLLKKTYEEFGFERVKNLLAVGGVSGTIKNWYTAEEPYIYAKTGTLSNNHNLSGFLKTKSGKWMIFSFMNNHYTVATSEVKTEMQALLESIRDTY